MKSTARSRQEHPVFGSYPTALLRLNIGVDAADDQVYAGVMAKSLIRIAIEETETGLKVTAHRRERLVASATLRFEPCRAVATELQAEPAYRAEFVNRLAVEVRRRTRGKARLIALAVPLQEVSGYKRADCIPVLPICMGDGDDRMVMVRLVPAAERRKQKTIKRRPEPVGPDRKRCTRCGETVLISDMHGAVCRSCRRTTDRERRDRRRRADVRKLVTTMNHESLERITAAAEQCAADVGGWTKLISNLRSLAKAGNFRATRALIRFRVLVAKHQQRERALAIQEADVLLRAGAVTHPLTAPVADNEPTDCPD